MLQALSYQTECLNLELISKEEGMLHWYELMCMNQPRRFREVGGTVTDLACAAAEAFMDGFYFSCHLKPRYR